MPASCSGPWPAQACLVTCSVLEERAGPGADHSGASSHHHTGCRAASTPGNLLAVTHALWGAPGRLGRHLSLLARGPGGAGHQQLRPPHGRRLRAPAALDCARAAGWHRASGPGQGAGSLTGLLQDASSVTVLTGLPAPDVQSSCRLCSARGCPGLRPASSNPLLCLAIPGRAPRMRASAGRATAAPPA